MRWLCLYFVASLGCVEPDTGQMYTCHGTFICYGDHFGLTESKGCASSLEEAMELYTEAILPLLQEAKCGSDYEIHVECRDLGDFCVYEPE